MQTANTAPAWTRSSQGPWTKRRKHQVVSFNDQILILGGFDGETSYDLNDVWSWKNDHWQQLTEHAGWSGRDGHTAVVLRNAIFVLGGTDDPFQCKSDVWQSTDGGSTWAELAQFSPWPERWQHAACAHGDKMFLSGGWGERFFNDVWYSTDGISWTCANSSAPWRSRMFHSMISFKGNLYVFGGHDGKVQLQDVWMSADDGFTWTQVLQAAPWPRRQGHATAIGRDTVYLMGGFGGSQRYNDFWKTSDMVNWVCVSANCEWTPRQGHAALYHHGRIYILGGFDESGYSNSVYCNIVDSSAVSELDVSTSETASNAVDADVDPNSPLRANRVDFTALTSAIDLLDDIRVQRDERDRMVRDIVYVVGVVTKVFKFSDFEARKRNSSNDLQDTERRSLLAQSSSSAARPPALQASVSATAGTGSTLDFSMIGSPFRENVLGQSAKQAPARDATRSFDVDQDTQLQFWQKLTEFSTNMTSPRDPSLSGSSDSALHSAALHEAIEQDKRTIQQIQRQIRNTSDQEQDGATPSKGIGELQQQRAVCARAAHPRVLAMEEHLNKIRITNEERQQDLLKSMSQLETVEKQQLSNSSSLNNNSSAGAGATSAAAVTQPEVSVSGSHRPSLTQRTRRSWEMILHRSSEILQTDSPFETDEAAQLLRDSLKAISTLSGHLASKVGQLVAEDEIVMQDDSTMSVEFDPSSSSRMHSSQDLVTQLGRELSQQSRRAGEVQAVIGNEKTQLAAARAELCSLLSDALVVGQDLVQRVYAQNSAITLEVTRLYDDLVSWKEKVTLWQSQDQLQAKCDAMMSEVASLEDQLLHWENSRIDLKSSLEKAMLSMSRSKLSRGQSQSQQSTASSAPPDSEVERLRNALGEAEREVKLARRTLRTWYRTHRKFAVHTAPELFGYLPDFKAPGSVLGDGGFAQSANIPRRQLSDYDDVTPFNCTDTSCYQSNSGSNNNNSSSSSLPASGRHLLLKAQYEDQEVILKGFVMHNRDQRRGMDREIEILGRLRSDMVIRPQAIVDASADAVDPTLQITLFIEYPFYGLGNLSEWVRREERRPWELQSIARQVLFAIMYVHDHGVVHKDIKPSNILLRDDGRIILTDFELARVVSSAENTGASNSNNNSGKYGGFTSPVADKVDDDGATITRSGTSGYMAPEVEAGIGAANFPCDMYSFGALLYYLHFPREFSQLLPGMVKFPPQADADICDLVQSLLAVDPSARPTAAVALTHPYFRATFVDRLMQEGEIVEQDRKLEAVRNLLSRTRASNRNTFDKATISRQSVVEDSLRYFQEVPVENLRKLLKVTFANEPGVDEGGLLTEMLSMFFDQVFSPSVGLFEDCNGLPVTPPSNTAAVGRGHLAELHADSAEESSENLNATTPGTHNSTSSGSSSAHSGGESFIVLPSASVPPQQLGRLRAVGRAMVKALYEGRRVGNRMCPSVLKFFTGASPTIRDLQVYDPQAAKSLQWLLTTVGVEELGLHFEEVAKPELGAVTDANKAQYVRLKVHKILVDDRLAQLTALKAGFLEALQGLSTEAAPFLTLLSHADWRIMLCGENLVSAPQIVAALRFTGFPRRSKVPQWLTELLMSASEDHLRKFLVFVTGSPSLAPSFSGSGSSSSHVKINVRHQMRSAALPTAHTCFFHLDIPDYEDRDVFQNKLFFAIQNANTFEIV